MALPMNSRSLPSQYSNDLEASRHPMMARPLPTSCATAPESLVQRVVDLEEYLRRNYDDRIDLERRLTTLEQGHVAIDSMILRMNEFGSLLQELPSTKQLRAVVSHLDWLSDWGNGTHFEQVLSKLDSRMRAIEDVVEKKCARIEGCWDEMRRVHSRYTHLEDCKADRTEHDALSSTTQAMFKDLRYFLDFKTDKLEADRLADALNERCRDFNTMILRKRHEVLEPLSHLPRNEFGSTLNHIDEAFKDLKKSHLYRQEEAERRSDSFSGFSATAPSIVFPNNGLSASLPRPLASPTSPLNNGTNGFRGLVRPSSARDETRTAESGRPNTLNRLH